MQRTVFCFALLIVIMPALPSKAQVSTTIRVANLDWQRDASSELGRQGHRANQASRRDAGSARKLLGTVLLYHVFVNDRDSTWTEAEQLNVGRRVNQAQAFIEKYAAHYGARVHIIHVLTTPVTIDESISTDAQANADWTDTAIRAASKTDAKGVVAAFRKSHHADNVLLVLHVNKTARSYNISYYRGVPRQFKAERLVCFTNISEGFATPSATYAHEILHGFGAGDLYFPFDQNDSRYLEAKYLCPNDVMFRIDDDIDRLDIATWTAYRVGWLDELPKKYAFMEDAR